MAVVDEARERPSTVRVFTLLEAPSAAE
jgi:hypothetical protein